MEFGDAPGSAATPAATMTAASLLSVGELRSVTVPIPDPLDDEALVRIEASGLCGSDLDRILVKGTYRFPTIPGHEFAGTVVRCPARPELVGSRVAVFPLVPCRTCPMCEIGEYAGCADYDYYGSRRDGGFAEFQAVKLANLVPVPSQLGIEDAAMIEPCAVAVHAVTAARLRLGDRIVIWGAGAIGLMAAQLADANGARVILVDLDEHKLEIGRELGLSAVNASDPGAPAEILRLTDGRGADVCLEAAGVPATLAGCIESAGHFGRVVLMGNPSGPMALEQNRYWQILRKQLTCVGVWNSSHNRTRDDWRTAITAIRRGQVTPSRFITHRFSLTECAAAVSAAASSDTMSLKVMFRTDEGVV